MRLQIGGRRQKPPAPLQGQVQSRAEKGSDDGNMGARTHTNDGRNVSFLHLKSANKNLVLQTKRIIHMLSLYSCYSHTCIHAYKHTHTTASKERVGATTQTPDYKNNHPHTELAILLHTHARRCLYSNPANCDGPSESHVSLKTYSLVP